jgi:hypothetical protein
MVDGKRQQQEKKEVAEEEGGEAAAPRHRSTRWRRRRKLPTQILVGSGSRPPGAGSLLQLRLPSPRAAS